LQELLDLFDTDINGSIDAEEYFLNPAPTPEKP